MKFVVKDPPDICKTRLNMVKAGEVFAFDRTAVTGFCIKGEGSGEYTELANGSQFTAGNLDAQTTDVWVPSFATMTVEW